MFLVLLLLLSGKTEAAVSDAVGVGMGFTKEDTVMAGGLMMQSARIALFAVAGMALGAVAAPAQAADLGGNCCADLEERIAELEATSARKGNRKVSLTVSGQVNEAILWFDAGDETNVYVGTNDTARTCFRFVGEAKIDSDWKAGYLLEIGVRANRLNRVNQDTDNGAGGLDLRHSAWWVESKTFGRVWVGL